MNAPARTRRGFSLVEILLAVALLGALLLALNIFLFSMGELWGRRSEQRLFDQHVRAVTRHVEAVLRTAELARVARPGVGGGITPQEVRLDTGTTEVLLTFELPEGDRVLPWPEQPLPDVVCSLAAREGKGLVLYWHSRLEENGTGTLPRALVLTPLVIGLDYEYYTPESRTWQSLPRPPSGREGSSLAPQGIRLRFAHGTLTAETRILLFPPTGALPSF